MALHLTKVAYGAQSLDDLRGWFAQRGATAMLTTRNLPKRHEEIAGLGSLFWIHKHHLVARSPIFGFEQVDGGRTGIVISTDLIDIRPTPRRAHQGWRYLEDKDAPADLASGDAAGDPLPLGLASELAKLGLV